MPRGGAVIYVQSELVIRESDGRTLFLVEWHGGDADRPLALAVFDPASQ